MSALGGKADVPWPSFLVSRRCAKISMLREGELRFHASSATRLPLSPQSHSSPPPQAAPRKRKRSLKTRPVRQIPICGPGPRPTARTALLVAMTVTCSSPRRPSRPPPPFGYIVTRNRYGPGALGSARLTQRRRGDEDRSRIIRRADRWDWDGGDDQQTSACYNLLYIRWISGRLRRKGRRSAAAAAGRASSHGRYCHQAQEVMFRPFDRSTIGEPMLQCISPLLALSGHCVDTRGCPLSMVKRTW